MRQRAIGLLVLSLLLFCPLSALAEMRIFQLHYHTAADLLPVIQQQLGAETRLSGYRDKLIVNGSADEIRRVEQLLSALDQERTQLHITVRQTRDRVAVGDAERATVRLGTEGSRLAAGGEYRLGNTGDSVQQQLLVLLGETAYIQVGKEMPYSRRWATWVGDTRGVAVDSAHRTIRTGFVVRPVRLEGDAVLLEITPRMETVGHRRHGELTLAPTVDFQRSASTVRVPLDKWFPLSSSLRQGDEVGREILHWQTGGGYERREVWLRVRR